MGAGACRASLPYSLEFGPLLAKMQECKHSAYLKIESPGLDRASGTGFEKRASTGINALKGLPAPMA